MSRSGATILFVSALLVGCGSEKPAPSGATDAPPTSPPKATDEASAVRLYREHLRKVGRSPERLGVSARRFGNYWLVYTAVTGMQPSIESLSIMQDGGKVFHDLIDGLTCAHMNAFKDSADPKEHHRLIKSFVELHCSDGALSEAVSIEKLADIPGYANRPLPDDLAGVVRPIWSFMDAQGSLVYVLCTYNRIGGKVRRYTFAFGQGRSFSKATCIELGRDVGDAAYYE